MLQPTTNGFANNTYRQNNKKTPYNKNRTRESSKQSESTYNNNNKNQKMSKDDTYDRKPLSDKKLHQTSTVPLVNGDNDKNTVKINATNNIINKKRMINPVLEKKILLESTKNIEMQNIDLMKTKSETLSRKSDVKVETTWVVVGGKRKMIQEEIPVEREKQMETIVQESVNRTEPTVTNGVTNDSSPSVNNAQTKKTSRKSKQKNKAQNKRNLPQGKNTKLQGFVIQEPTFTSTAPSEPEPEVVESDVEEHQEIVESDTEELLEASLIETIPWTDVDIAEVTTETDDSTEKLSDLSEASSASASIIIVNVNNNNETEKEEHKSSEQCKEETEQNCGEQETFQNTEELDQIKAEPIVNLPETEIKESDTNCSIEISENPIEEVLEERHLNGFSHENPIEETRVVQEMIVREPEIVEEIQTKVVTVKNGLTNHHVIIPETKMSNGSDETDFFVKEMLCHTISTDQSQSCPSELASPTKTENDAAILEINETQSKKYLLTAAVCNWLHTFNNNDLQSLFTIPLSPDFVQKIKYCTEISQYFADDELQNLDKFINENFCKYQHLSASSSLSSLLSDLSGSSDEDDDESEPTSEHTQKAIGSTKATKKALKLFGCEIM